MRTETASVCGENATITYPDEKTFAFNPNYVLFEGLADDVRFIELDFYDISFKLRASVYNHKAKIDISEVIQLYFDNPREKRVKHIPVYYSANAEQEREGRFWFDAIWGYVVIGERLNTMGAYTMNKDSNMFERHIRWFHNLPQKLCLYDGEDFLLFKPTRTKYTYGLYDTTAINDLVWDDTFDDTFKIAFKWRDNVPATIYLHKDDSKDGYFMRWIDNLGHWQYFLFVKNSRTVKPKMTNETNAEIKASGMYFGGGTKRNKSKSVSITCAACNVTKELMPYLQTIVTSPIVDLYMGESFNGEEIWMPVNIEDADYEYSEQKEMQNFEIRFVPPTNNNQQI